MHLVFGVYQNIINSIFLLRNIYMRPYQRPRRPQLLLLLRILLTTIVNFRDAMGNILVVGSMNLDSILMVDRLPKPGENVMTVPYADVRDVPGGKGCNQAIAAAKLSKSQSNQIKFLGRFGDDAASVVLREALECENVDLSLCDDAYDECILQKQPSMVSSLTSSSSGRGYVFVQKSDGAVSAVVVGGSNMEGWWPRPSNHECDATVDVEHLKVFEERVDALFSKPNLSGDCGIKAVMLQCEVPEYVNIAVAKAARKRGWTVMLDIGGEERMLSDEMLQLCNFISPNFTELERLCMTSFGNDSLGSSEDECSLEEIVKAAHMLQYHNKSCNVLVSLGKRGSVLICTGQDGKTIFQPAQPLPPGQSVVDETGAGDCFRAAFMTAYTDGESYEQCLRYASAAGALAVTREGAVPSIPSREDIDTLLNSNSNERSSSPLQFSNNQLRGGEINEGKQNDDIDDFPLLFGSRLNSMKDRPELWDGENGVRGWVKRQGTIKGLGCVDFNYPQHFGEWTSKEAKEALNEAGLVAGAVCLRYPHLQFQQGAMTHPDPKVRNEAIKLTKRAAQTARDLGANEVVVWSAYDGYDYVFQVNHNEKWDQIVRAFQECCDEFPDIKFSLEFKPTDENTRFFAVPSTGAAILLVNEIDRPNMGLTLDVGHMLMAGENPGQSIALAGTKSKLFGVQLNDGYTRLAAEDGMMFGSVHPGMALEIMYYLQMVNFKGHLYFDTFPQRTDPVKEAEYNIKRVKQFWKAAEMLESLGVRDIQKTHDALRALKMVDDAIYGSLYER